MGSELERQIGDYGPRSPDIKGKPNLSNEDLVKQLLPTQNERKELYAGYEKYAKHHQRAIAAWDPKVDDNAKNDPQYFRKAFVQFIENIEKNPHYLSYAGTDEDRKKHPEKATLKVENFLSKEGLKLYKLALDEEMHSIEYRNAVFCAATSYFPGETWKERPVVTVSGPSGCGKSYAAKTVLDIASEKIETQPGTDTGNYVVTVDGGIGREVSQMRKLLIRAANNKGFSGLKDLDDQSKALGPTKGYIQKAVFTDPKSKLGVVNPNTFSRWSFDGKDCKRMKKVDKMPGTKQFFCRVEGQDSKIFENVVAFMGSRRAWKTDFSEPTTELDMNSTVGLNESKAYHGGSKFLAGVYGSFAAESWFIRHTKPENYTIKLTNDLILVKADDVSGWREAKQGEEGAKLISQRIFSQWLATNEPRENLDLFAKKNPQTPLISIRENKEALSAIKSTSSIIQEQVRETFVIINREFEKIQALVGKEPVYQRMISLVRREFMKLIVLLAGHIQHPLKKTQFDNPKSTTNPQTGSAEQYGAYRHQVHTLRINETSSETPDSSNSSKPIG